MPLRRLLAAGLAAVTVGGTAYLALHRPPEDAVPVLVARHAVPVGQVLTEDDVQLRQVVRSAVPTEALTGAEQAVDRVTVAPLVAGEVLTGLDVHTAGLLTGLADGTSAVFLPLAETTVAQAVTAADRVDVHSPVDGAVVVTEALVLRSTAGDEPGLWLAVDRDGARALAVARGQDPAGAALQVAITPPAPDS